MATLHALAAQAVRTNGGEPTFDGVPLVPGVHIRWTFAAELGFPPHGFRLFRKEITPGEKEFLPPVAANPQSDQAGGYEGGLKLAPGVSAPGRPVWLPPDARGWSLLSQPLTIPLTRVNWPARYPGAPDPSVAPPAVVLAADLEEAKRRLDGAAPELRLEEVRAELDTLVAGFPGVKLFDVPSEPVPDGAPAVGLTPMRRLLLFALNPHLARVLGLSYVDTDVAPGVDYMYYVMGLWFGAAAASDVFTPGLGQPHALGRGWSVMDGATISSPGAVPPDAAVSGAPTSWFWRWLRDVTPQLDATTPPDPHDALTAVTGGLGSSAPAALLAAQSADGAPRTVCRITFRQPVMQVEVQVAGNGSITALADDPSLPVIATASFNSLTLTGVSVFAPSRNQPIRAVDISVAFPLLPFHPASMLVIVGNVTAHLLSGDFIGDPGAMISSINALTAPDAPGRPSAFFRGRQAVIDESGPALVPRSTFEVQWPSPARTPADVSGDPLSDPLALPPPTRAVGFIAERGDTGGGSAPVDHLIFAASQPRTSDTPAGVDRIYRLIDGDTPDPAGAYVYRVAGYDLFGARGPWSEASNEIGVERLAVAPTTARVRRFANSSADGGAPNGDGSAWVGSTLTLDVAWSGGALVDYPDTRSARVRVTALDATPEEVLSPPFDLDVPAATPLGGVITGVTYDAATHIVSLTTSPAFPAMDTSGQPGLLITSAPPGRAGSPNWERFTALAVNTAAGVATVFPSGSGARIVTAPGDYIGRAAYLVRSFAKTVTLHPPLAVPVDRRTARAAVDVLPSRATPFDPSEQVIDPNNRLPPRSPTPSERVIVVGQQWLTPHAPDQPIEGPFTHIVHHRYYDPADFNAVAGVTLNAFTTPARTGVLGYRLMRTPVETLALADIARMLKHGGLAALAPTTLPDGSARADLTTWLGTYSDWLTTYNAWVAVENARRARRGLPPLNTVDEVSALTDDTARRAFIEHFYGSLLDDELRALGDQPELQDTYTRAALDHIAPGDPVTDTVDGKGSGRTLYKLKSINDAGSDSAMTNSSGPYYLRPVAPPPAPGWLQAIQNSGHAGLQLVWPFSASPNVAGYLVYRATSGGELDDLRYFGPDRTHPLPPDQQPRLVYAPTSQPAISFDRIADPRILTIAPDPRLFARDYEGSDMAEVTLPAGVTPTGILGVFRLDRFDATASPITTQPAAFNYYRQTGDYTARFVPAEAGRPARVVGLRVGLGMGAPVVVIADTTGGPFALGTLPVYGGASAPIITYQDATATSGTTYTYTIVAVDTYGNRSIPSPRASGQAL